MRHLSRGKQLVIATVAALLLITGALNLRFAIGSDSGGEWEVDPAAPSQIDLLTGAPIRTPNDLDSLIVSYQDELRAHPSNSDAATLLGHAYLQKARETGDPAYYPKAEELFTNAFDRNDQDFGAAIGLGTLALARHDFTDGLMWGERAKALNPYSTAAYGVIGDALIELGRYDEAIVVIQQMVDLRPELASFARVSYIRELTGDVSGAIDAMERAAEAGASRAENVAWTQVQIGNLRFNSGDLEGAEAQYNASLTTLEDYVYGMAGLGKVAAARGEVDSAVDYYTRAIQRMPLPEFVIALGEMYEANGQPGEATKQYELVRAMIQLYSANGVDTDIELALFLADHGSDPASAVEKAREGYSKRPGVKTADVLSWALYRAGEYDDAWTYAQEALRLGTQDATMYFHAGMIAAALGDSATAGAYLTQALTINPWFSPLHVAEAGETLNLIQASS